MRPVVVYHSQNCEVRLSSNGAQGVLVQARYYVESPISRRVDVVLQNEVPVYVQGGQVNPEFKKDIAKFIKESIHKLKSYQSGDLIVKRLLGEFRQSYMSLQENLDEVKHEE